MLFSEAGQQQSIAARARNAFKTRAMGEESSISARERARIHLCEFETNDLAEDLNLLFDRVVEIPRMRHGSRQTVDTLINEEAYLLAKFLRNEKETWIPRIADVRWLGWIN